MLGFINVLGRRSFDVLAPPLFAPKKSTAPVFVFSGHTKAVVSVKCVSAGSVLLSGSEDGTAMLWSLSSGACLQEFIGHTRPLRDVAVIDQVTVLTASRDSTIRARDVLFGDAFRTYQSSTKVTAVATGDQSG